MMMRPDAPHVVLASGSASRRAVLQAAGVAFEIATPQVDEAAIKDACRAEDVPVADTALILADAKASRIARTRPDDLVIAADQMLVCDGAWYDKPADMEAARVQLQALRGRKHELVSGMVAWRGGHRVWQDVTVSPMEMRDFSDEFLDAYLALEGPTLLGSVGAYRLEGPGVQLFARVGGEHSAILGLPLMPLLRFLRQHHVLLD
ncbi:Maf family protein [Plastoroseomonas arctica]|uniref:Nucleoside triphosphate pyrophosphatase n=1 Tax=Plastoroseomonas arctica TaxID=1509237 RepID=A0AAF1KUM2_9PROT|nr:nucleoside triphosphate pyrophosphatase [Plastoroseomonas arctica]MBR0656487.1 Maf-like protein [Plastoroseomonas arctica]